MPENAPYTISLAAWSMHRMFFAGEVDQLGMVALTRELGIDALELVNTFFPSPQYCYLRELRRRADDAGVSLTLIMCDGEGDMAARGSHASACWRRRTTTSGWTSRRCWAARRSARTPAAGQATTTHSSATPRASRELVEYAAAADIDVLVENHFGLSQDAAVARRARASSSIRRASARCRTSATCRQRPTAMKRCGR